MTSSQQGVAARALVRNPQKAQNLPGITWVTGDLAKPETLPTAFEGAKTLFLVSSIGEDTVALQHNAIEAARNAGMTHIVKLSAFAASGHSTAPICLWHYQVEKEMQESGMDWTILRPHHFMQNLVTQTQFWCPFRCPFYHLLPLPATLRIPLGSSTCRVRRSPV